MWWRFFHFILECVFYFISGAFKRKVSFFHLFEFHFSSDSIEIHQHNRIVSLKVCVVYNDYTKHYHAFHWTSSIWKKKHVFFKWWNMLLLFVVVKVQKTQNTLLNFMFKVNEQYQTHINQIKIHLVLLFFFPSFSHHVAWKRKSMWNRNHS